MRPQSPLYRAVERSKKDVLLAFVDYMHESTERRLGLLTMASNTLDENVLAGESSEGNVVSKRLFNRSIITFKK